MASDLYDVRSDGSVVVRVHVQPGAGRTAVRGRFGDALKVSVAAPPAGGRANAAVTELLADLLGVKPAAVTLVAGETSRAKRVQVTGLEPDEVGDRLERALADTSRRPGERDRF